MTYNAKMQIFDPLVEGVKRHDRKKTKPYPDFTYQTTVENGPLCRNSALQGTNEALKVRYVFYGYFFFSKHKRRNKI